MTHDIAPRFTDTEGASKYLGISRSYLEKLRVTGTGPEFVLFGRSVRYAVRSLDEWAEGCRHRSTSEPKGGAGVETRTR